ncbi:hypothetical protein ISCGN_018217 [Ixodes scapularis]
MAASRIIFVFALLNIHASEVTDFVERRPELSPYQDAWKALIAPGRYFLYQRSYECEPFLGWDSKCVNAELVTILEEEKTTVTKVGYWDSKKEEMVTITAYSSVRASKGYDVPNIITSSNMKGGFSVEYPVVFSEYDNCDVLRVAHRRYGCELWVQEGKIDKISSICKFVYDLVCGSEKYQIYDEELCDGK